MRSISGLLLLFLLLFNIPLVSAEKPDGCSCPVATPGKSQFDSYVSGLYKDMDLGSYGLKSEVFRRALVGFYNMEAKSMVKRNVVTIVDFDKPSTQKRLWIIDLNAKKVMKNSLVAHGKKSGENHAVKFSNIVHSNMSSLGFYVTGNTYQGKHGLSLRLEGVDQFYNSKAMERAVVIHGAEYVSEDFIKCNGRLGRSQGCPAVPVSENKEIIQMIKNGSVLFIHHSSLTEKACFLDEPVAIMQFLKKMT